MQDHVIPTRARASSGFRITIPAMIVDWVRRATYAEIGLAAEKLDTAAFASDREAHPEWFLGPAANLRESYALLDRIGWSKTTPPLAVQIELRDYGWALLRALEGALEFADEEVGDHVGEYVEPAATHLGSGARRGSGAGGDLVAFHCRGAGMHRRARRARRFCSASRGLSAPRRSGRSRVPVTSTVVRRVSRIIRETLQAPNPKRAPVVINPAKSRQIKVKKSCFRRAHEYNTKPYARQLAPALRQTAGGRDTGGMNSHAGSEYPYTRP